MTHWDSSSRAVNWAVNVATFDSSSLMRDLATVNWRSRSFKSDVKARSWVESSSVDGKDTPDDGKEEMRDAIG